MQIKMIFKRKNKSQASKPSPPESEAKLQQ